MVALVQIILQDDSTVGAGKKKPPSNQYRLWYLLPNLPETQWPDLFHLQSFGICGKIALYLPTIDTILA
jgi:hypothetical protein